MVSPEAAVVVGNASVAVMAAVQPPPSSVNVSGHLQLPSGRCSNVLSSSGMDLRQVSRESGRRVKG